jgi:hypothetical protein
VHDVRPQRWDQQQPLHDRRGMEGSISQTRVKHRYLPLLRQTEQFLAGNGINVAYIMDRCLPMARCAGASIMSGLPPPPVSALADARVVGESWRLS